jgi:hypothetical protein
MATAGGGRRVPRSTGASTLAVTLAARSSVENELIWGLYVVIDVKE